MGIAAAYWTALCLTRIEERFPSFPRHVRVVVRAGGGAILQDLASSVLDRGLLLGQALVHQGDQAPLAGRLQSHGHGRRVRRQVVAALPAREISQRAVQLLTEVIENPTREPRTEVVAESLIVRESTAVPRP